MTISSEVNRVTISSGSTITITNLEATAAAQIVVTKKSAAGVDSTFVITTDYTIDIGLDTVTLVVALVADETATATLSIPVTQATDYKNASPLNAETIETMGDKITLMIKGIKELIARAPKFQVSATETDVEMEDITGNADKYLKLNSAGTSMEWNTLSATAGLGNLIEDVTPQLGADLDANAFDMQFDDATGIRDDSDNETLIFQKIASAVNYIDIFNAATSNAPLVQAAGSDADVDLDLRPKGTGNVTVGDGTDTTKKISFESSGATTAKTLTITTAHTANRTITLPNVTDTLVGKATTDTLTNKTLTTPIISSISNSGTITIPTGTDTLIGKATTDTLTNKTLTSPTLTTPVLGTPSSGDISACTSTGLVLVTPALGTPASGDLSNCTNPVDTSGNTVQEVNTQTGTSATGTTLIPVDSSIPQNTEGDEYMTVAITPTNSDNKLKIDVVVVCSHSVLTTRTFALFQDTTAGSLASAVDFEDNIGGTCTVSFTHYMTAGTTSATTFKLRAGGGNTGTFTINPLNGGVNASSITIKEIKV